MPGNDVSVGFRHSRYQVTMIEYAGPHYHAIGKVASNLRSHEVCNLGLVCKDYRELLTDQLHPDNLRQRALAEKRNILETFVEKLDKIHLSTAEQLAERLGTLGVLRPATLDKLASSIHPSRILQGLYPAFSRDVLPVLRSDDIRQFFQTALTCPDSYRKYVSLSSLGHSAEHFPKDALPELRTEVGLVNPGWRQYVYSSVGQLSRGFSGETADEQALRDTLITGVFDMPAEAKAALAPKAALAGLWPSLNEQQRLSVAQATTQLLRDSKDEEYFAGLSHVNTRSHDVSLRASTQAFGDIVHTLPDAERTAFVQALVDLPDKHFAQTVDMLGDTFHQKFPAVFSDARSRVRARLAEGTLNVHDIPLRIRPHEAVGVPHSLRSNPSFRLSDQPLLTYRELLNSDSNHGLTPDETRKLSEMLADEKNSSTVLQQIEAATDNAILSTIEHIGVFKPKDQVKLIDILAAKDSLQHVSTSFFLGIDPSAEKSVISHAKQLLATDANAALPPVTHLSDTILRNELSTSELAHWKAVSQTQILNRRQFEIARELNAASPNLHYQETQGLDAWLETERRQWLASLSVQKQKT